MLAEHNDECAVVHHVAGVSLTLPMAAYLDVLILHKTEFMLVCIVGDLNSATWW